MYSELNKLKKVLINEKFKFIIIEYSDYEVIKETEEFLNKSFPARKVIKLGKEINEFSEIMGKIEVLKSGFVFVENFEYFLENEKIYSGLNQKRDGLAEYDIALVCFISTMFEEEILKKCYTNIPDLWEFRNILLKVEREHIKKIENIYEKFDEYKVEKSTVGGVNLKGKKEKLLELEKILEIIKEVPENYSLIFNYYKQIILISQESYEYTKEKEFLEKFSIFLKKIKQYITNMDYNKNILFIYMQMGNNYNNRGNLEEAVIYYKKALEIIEKELPLNYLDLAGTYNNIGTVYIVKGNIEEALSYYKKALEIMEKELPSNHPDLASSYNNIGNIYSIRGNIEEALSYYKKALEIKEKELLSNHPGLASSYNNIGNIYSIRGNIEEALSYYKKALEIREKELPSNHPDLASTYNNIGTVYRVKGNIEEALSYYKKALEIMEKELPSNHPDLASSYNNIGNIYSIRGNIEEALSYYKKALEIMKKELPSNHPDLANIYNNIGNAYRASGKEKKALEYYQKASTNKKK